MSDSTEKRNLEAKTELIFSKGEISVHAGMILIVYLHGLSGLHPAGAVHGTSSRRWPKSGEPGEVPGGTPHSGPACHTGQSVSLTSSSPSFSLIFFALH